MCNTHTERERERACVMYICVCNTHAQREREGVHVCNTHKHRETHTNTEKSQDKFAHAINFSRELQQFLNITSRKKILRPEKKKIP